MTRDTVLTDERLREIDGSLGDDTFSGITRTKGVKVPELRAILTELLARRSSTGEAVATLHRSIAGPPEQLLSHGWVPDLLGYTSTALYAHPLPSPQPAVEVKAWADVVAERQRQVQAEGWTAEHDDEEHDRGELARAAGCYALADVLATTEVDGPGSYVVPEHWPWAPEWWKPTDRRRNLVKAAALLLAEIEHLDRVSIVGGGA